MSEIDKIEQTEASSNSIILTEDQKKHVQDLANSTKDWQARLENLCETITYIVEGSPEIIRAEAYLAAAEDMYQETTNRFIDASITAKIEKNETLFGLGGESPKTAELRNAWQDTELENMLEAREEKCRSLCSNIAEQAGLTLSEQTGSEVLKAKQDARNVKLHAEQNAVAP